MSKATRDSFGEAIRQLGAEKQNIVVLDADLSCSTKSALFAKEFPNRFFQMGIAESNMVGTAAGLSFTGFVPFLCSFGAFVVGRYETIRVSVGYSRANVKIVGTHAGLGIGEDGYTQMGLEDLNVLRALPNFTLLQPCDDATTKAAVRYAAEHTGPVYLRLTRQKLPAIHKDEKVFQAGRGIILQEGGDVALIGSGSTVTELLTASQLMSGVKPWIIDMHTIKPIDRSLLKSLATKCKLIVTAEDHNVVGGLGSAVAEQLVEFGYPGKLLRIGVENYGESGLADELYEKYGISGKRIAERVQAQLTTSR